MNCYECAVQGESREAVGICRLCGRAACPEHSCVQHMPQFEDRGVGMGGPVVRLPQDRPRFVCRECQAVVGLRAPEEV